uniref:Uncharacterized protein n=1 Tax=Tanacetum cinerariifolium TaxID=118510 RepID=A0A6L2LPB5_TANCI|nr:hypothetical protein [Tanacetum cinerariifolium]
MAAHGSSNVLARHAIDEIAEFSGDTKVPKYMKVFILQEISEVRRLATVLRDEARIVRTCLAQVNAMIAELEAKDDQMEVYDSLMCLRDSRRIANDKLLGLNDTIDDGEEEITPMKFMWRLWMHQSTQKDAKSFRLHDKMKLWFTQAHTEEESFAEEIRDFCFGLRVTLSKNRRLIAELEALGQRGDALRSMGVWICVCEVLKALMFAVYKDIAIQFPPGMGLLVYECWFDSRACSYILQLLHHSTWVMSVAAFAAGNAGASMENSRNLRT